MNPQEFLDLARRLAAGKGTAEMRSAVSRAYYAAFHASAALIEECGVRLPMSAAAHEKAVYCLRESGDARLISTADILNSLRSDRNIADYRLKDSRFDRRKSVELLITAAKTVFDTLTIARGDLPAFRERIRDYARVTLGLSVT